MADLPSWLPGGKAQPEPEPEPAAHEPAWDLDADEDWRLGQLQRAGYDYISALELAINPQVDLHRACDLVTRRGCPPELAREILL